MHHATTKGIDEETAFRHTDIQWLGDVPAHWEVKKIRRLALVKRGASPRPIDNPIYFDDQGEYAWVRISDVSASGKYLQVTEQRLSPLGQSKSVTLQPGNLFVSIAGSVGKPIISGIKCCIHDGFVYFDGLRESPGYLYYLFAAGQLYKGLGKLGTQLNLNTDTIGSIHIPVPSADTQKRIVQFLDRTTTELDRLASIVDVHIATLQERRAALITAAVTGQIDVSRETA